MIDDRLLATVGAAAIGSVALYEVSRLDPPTATQLGSPAVSLVEIAAVLVAVGLVSLLVSVIGPVPDSGSG